MQHTWNAGFESTETEQLIARKPSHERRRLIIQLILVALAVLFLIGVILAIASAFFAK
jgi:hypothetical protein